MTSSLPPQLLVAQIFAALRRRYAVLNRERHRQPLLHYEAAWTESFVHLRCYHQHETLLDAAKCAMKQGIPGWYCIAVKFDKPRQLNANEETIVNRFRFGPHLGRNRNS